MMESFKKIQDKIEEQQSTLLKWKAELKNNLSINNDKKICADIFLIRKKWLENYEKKIMYCKIYNKELFIKSYDNFDKLNNEKLDLFQTKNAINKKFPEFFPLNKNCWLSFQKTDINNYYIKKDKVKEIPCKGYFLNNVLFIEGKSDSKSKLFLIFFNDNNNLRQGYLIVNDLRKETSIIKNFKEMNISKIFQKKKLAKNDLYYELSDLNNYDLYILKFKNNKFERNDTLRESYRKNKKDIKIHNNDAGKKIEDENIKNDILFDVIKINDLRPKKEVNKRSSSAHMRILKVDKKLIDKINLNLEGFLPKAVHKKSTPGIIGLANIGATCYMNATLQCFSNIKGLRLNLLNKDKYIDLVKNKDSKNKLSFALAEVLKNLWENNNIRFYAPEYFKKIISEMNPLFKGIAANDPKDLILFLLETIHKELNKPKNINIINNNNIDSTNFVEVFNDFSNYYISKNKSIISDEFYGFNNAMTVCGFCQIPIFNVQSFNILFFPLEEVRNYKEYDFNSVNIYDCFDYYQKQDIYPSFYCNNCNKNYYAFQQSNLLSSPKTIIINLNRGKGIEFNINIIFEEYLNLKNYIIFEDSPYYYELIGVISHFGSNDMGGHFIAFCKNSNNCEWYKYNDQMVTKSSFNEITQSGLPYVLFYSYIKA